MNGLADALVANRVDIERELAAAERELVAIEGREAELRVLIGRARFALGLDAIPAIAEERANIARPPRLTLHEALLEVLRPTGERGMTATELAEAVNASGLYRKRDGSPIEAAQIYARTHNYATLFERENGRIRARRPA
jgi:hypothetical protein